MRFADSRGYEAKKATIVGLCVHVFGVKRVLLQWTEMQLVMKRRNTAWTESHATLLRRKAGVLPVEKDRDPRRVNVVVWKERGGEREKVCG